MFTVKVGGNDRLVCSGKQPRCQLLAVFVRLFRRNLARGEGLYQVVAKYSLFSAGFVPAPLCRHHIGIGSLRAAVKSADIQTFLGFARVLDVVQRVGERSCLFFSLAF